MRRFLLSMLLLLAVLVAVIGGTAWYLLHDEAFLKARLSGYVLDTTGRELSVDGPLRVIPGRRTTIEAEGIRLANADWAEPPEMVRIGRLRLVLDVLSVFGAKRIIPLVTIEDCNLALIERDDGITNWGLLPETPDPDHLPILLLDAQIRHCSLSHAAPGREQPLQIEIASLSQQLRTDQRWQVEGNGRIDGDPVIIDGWLSPASALVSGGPLEHKLDIRIGKTTLQSSGTVQDMATGQGANIEARLHGPEIANVLAYLGLPAVSSGPFDLGLRLDSAGQMTRLSLAGDLGQVQARAQGEFDRLMDPSQGRISGTFEGPNLAPLGRAFGIEGLAPDTYALDADVGFEPGRVRFNLFELVMPSDRLSILGVLGTATGLAGTDLDINAQSEEPGRWAGAFGRPVRDIGAMTLTGRLLSDALGRGTLRARVEHPGSSLTLDGSLGALAGPLHPDLKIDFHSSDPRQLASLLGDFTLPQAPLSIRGQIAKPAGLLVLKGLDIALGGHAAVLDGQVNPEAPFSGSEVDLEMRSPNAAELGQIFDRKGLPSAPFTLTGRISRPGQRIRFEGVKLDLAGHQVSVNGLLNPNQKYAGSEFDIQLDTPDVAALALLFGKEGLPHEAMTLKGMLKPEGKGLQFETEQGRVGEIRLVVDGRIPDLDQPLALDATFDIELPSLTLLAFLAPETKLPDLPFTARGALRNKQKWSRLDGVELTLGDFKARLDGDLHADHSFALSVEADGPDASQLQQWVGLSLATEPFSLRTRLSGNPQAVELTEIDARLGKSRASGQLQLGLGTPRMLRGSLVSPLLDLTHWNNREKSAPPTDPKQSSGFVFDDRKVMWVEDYGIDIDAELKVAELDLGNTQLFDIELGIMLGRSSLEFSPFSFRGSRGGTFHGSVSLDDSGVKPVLDVDMNGQDLRLGLTAAPGQDTGTFPPLELHLVLHGSGFTRREMASSLDGKIRAYSGTGLVASAGIDLLFSDFLTELFEALNPLAETNDFTQLDCSVWAADIVAGRVTVDPLIAHTEAFTILSEGTIDLQTEKINMSFNTKPRKGLGITPGTVINTLIKVGGTLQKPAIEIDPAGAIVGGTAAVATAGLSILARGFSDRFLSSRDPCGDARKALAKRDGG